MRAYPMIFGSLGKKSCCKSLNSAGKVFFCAKSPLAPRTTMMVLSVKASPLVSIEGMYPRLLGPLEGMVAGLGGGMCG